MYWIVFPFFTSRNSLHWWYCAYLWTRIEFNWCALEIEQKRLLGYNVGWVKRSTIWHSCFCFPFFGLSDFAWSWPCLVSYNVTYSTSSMPCCGFVTFSALMWPCVVSTCYRVATWFLHVAIFLTSKALHDCASSGKLLAVFNLIIFYETLCD